MDEDWFTAYRREVYEDMQRSGDPTMPEEMPEAVGAILHEWRTGTKYAYDKDEVYAAIRAALMTAPPDGD